MKEIHAARLSKAEREKEEVAHYARIVFSDMSCNSLDSSLEVTKSNEVDIKAGMLKLAITCSHLLEQSAKKVPLFKAGDEVFLMNPPTIHEKVATGSINRLPGESTFHFKEIPDVWMKVDVRDILHASVAIMFPYKKVDMTLIEDAKGSMAMWDTK